MVLFLVFSFINRINFRRTTMMMRMTGALALIGCVSELVFVIVAVNPEASEMSKRLLSLVNNSTMLLCSFYFNRYTMTVIMKDGHRKFRKYFGVFNIVFIILFHLLLLGDLKFKYVYSSFEGGVAKGGNLLMFVGYGCPVMYLLLGIFSIFRFRKEETRREFLALLTTHVLVILGAAIQAVTSDMILMVSFGITMGLYVIYSFLEAPDYYRLLESNRLLAEAEKTAKDASRAKSEFLSSMSHEIRTPMNAVLGMNELTSMALADPTIPDDQKIEKAAAYSESIRESGETLMYLINDILDISKIESGKMEIIEAPYFMKDLLNEVCSVFRVLSDRKGLAFISDIDDSLPGYVNGDRVRFRQVIVNILNNAVKYTEEGKITLKVTGTVEGDTVYYDMSVTDTGIGIREENIDHIFDAFDRVDDEKTHFIEGTGLGLSIVKKIVGLMGGNVGVTSVYGEGSVFSFRIPQKILGDQKMSDFIGKTGAAGEVRERGFEGTRILVVDDNITNIAVAGSFLEKLKVTTDSATSGAEALSMIAENSYDLIFLDHMMPVMSGDIVLATVRGDPERYSRNKDTPVIAMTANAISGQKEIYINEYGFDGYLAKPFRFSDLKATIEEYLKKGSPVKTDDHRAPPGMAADDTKGSETGGLPSAEESPSEIEKNEADSGKDDSFMEEKAQIDKATGLMLCENQDIYDAVIQAYLSEEQMSIDALNEAYEAENWAEYRTQVHKLKSGSKTVGAVAFSDFSLQMETCAKDIIADNEKEKALDFIKTNYAEYLEVYKKVCENLNNI